MHATDATPGAILILGTLDTKGDEHAFLRDCIRDAGRDTVIVDLGILGEPRFAPDVSADEVVSAAGGSLIRLRAAGDKSAAIATMAAGAAIVARRLYDKGAIGGVVALGGGQGTEMAGTAMRALPLGVPKLLVSTVVGVEGPGMSRVVGTRDLTLMNSVIDISGLNSIARVIIANAAGAIVGMAGTGRAAARKGGPLRVSATMFGVTTPCVTRVREQLEADGSEVMVFAATGSGDRAMEDLIAQGLIDAVIDVTPSQVGQDLVLGGDRAGPDRLEVAGRMGLPQVVAPGGLDIVNLTNPADPLREEAARGERKWVMHNPQLTVVRPTIAESARIGSLVAKKLNGALGPVTFVIPAGGWSQFSGPDGPLFDPDADAALLHALTAALRPEIKVITLPHHINEPGFADELVAELRRLLEVDYSRSGAHDDQRNHTEVVKK